MVSDVTGVVFHKEDGCLNDFELVLAFSGHNSAEKPDPKVPP